jgi:PAS domain S-box-containing protein
LADGTTSIFLIHLFPIADENGRKMAGGHAVHLPDKFEIENRLRESNEQLLNINRAAHNAIWEWDMVSGNIFRNEHLLEMIGYAIEKTMNLDWWLDHVHPEDREQLETTIAGAAKKKQMSWEQTYRFKCADDSYKYIVDSGFVVYENNQPIKMIGSLKDVTELRVLENRLVEEKLQKQKEISETMIEVQERERMRLGVELHDNVNQILTSVRLYIAMLNPENAANKGIKDKCLCYLDTAMEEIRKLSKDLVVPQLKGNTLVENIKSLIADVSDCSGLKIDFAYSHETFLLSAAKKLALFRITQEQIKNILKYSKAKTANILLQHKDGHIELIIKDDGIGFNPAKTLRGVGLSSIHERARFYNGGVEIKTSEGKGCMIKVNIPLL